MSGVTFAELARRLLIFAARYHAEGDDGWAQEAVEFILEAAAVAALRRPEMRAKVAATLATSLIPALHKYPLRLDGWDRYSQQHGPEAGEARRLQREQRGLRLVLFWALAEVPRG